MFVQIQTNLITHPRLGALARELGVTRPAALGILAAVWCAALEHAPDGDLQDLHPEDLAAAIQLPALEGARVSSALEATGWIVDGRLHAWESHTGGALHRRAREAEKKRKQRRRGSTQGTVPSMSPGTVPTLSPACPPMSPLEPEPEPEPEQEPEPPTLTGGGPGEGALRSPTPPQAGPPAEPAQGEPIEKAPKRPAKQKKRRTPPPTWADLLKGLEGANADAVAALRERFPAYDGQNGRQTVEEVLEHARSWWESAAPSKRWKTPAGIVAWFSRDYGRAVYRWEADIRENRVARPSRPRPTKSWEELERERDREWAAERGQEPVQPKPDPEAAQVWAMLK